MKNIDALNRMKNLDPKTTLEQAQRKQEQLRKEMNATPRQNLIWLLGFLLIVVVIIAFVKFH